MLKFVFIIAFTEFRLFQSAKAKQIVENKKSLKDTCNLSLISFKKKNTQNGITTLLQSLIKFLFHSNNKKASTPVATQEANRLDGVNVGARCSKKISKLTGGAFSQPSNDVVSDER
jgi:hypothetical protein